MDDDGGAYANDNLPYKVNPADCTSSKVLAVPRCCQKRKGTQDRSRINFEVADRGARSRSGEVRTNGTGQYEDSPMLSLS
ncbi:uncharacterized protein MAM_08296 [Metarhizium album ARSEF 1941]|uniref:Uncharacterized protein n=1 Tax=Metarhizium album (strain ARSEF 1941) TaxID=1081103 RepID=A0A0B2WJK8_METAS|nr:uncharacterized protein MAM_08296 [Metarhizium album ARSEF 1941]KHN93874.1 hypothetical protein MAM_08296 [Metarhizium album ARSEF 1941]